MSMFTEAFTDLLAGHCPPATVRAIESGGDALPLWNAVAEAGFLELMAVEDAGGAGLDLAETMPLLVALGAHAVPLPIGQAIALRSLLAPGEAPPEGIVTLAPALRRQPDGRWLAPRVPHGTQADWVVAEFDGQALLLDARAAERGPAVVHAEATCDLQWTQPGRRLEGPCPAGAVTAWGAALHAALIAGALQRAFDLTLQYANDRVQFGKPIGRFQAIQHQVSVMAEHVAAARMAASIAFARGRRTPAPLAAAVAKARASEAAALVAGIAHAVHGAIGITGEFDLQLFTRRLHAWRLAHGSEAHWHRVVGQALLDRAGTGSGDFVRSLSTHTTETPS